MKPHVDKVIDLWKNSLENPPEKVQRYGMSDQLRNLAALFTPGPFYYYILNFPLLELEYLHEGTQEVLGLDPEGATIQKLLEFLPPGERQPMAQKEAVVVDFFMNFLDPMDRLDYKIAYFFKIEDANGKVRNMLHQATVLTLTEDHQIEHVLVVHTDVSHLKFIRKNTLSFIHLRGKKSFFHVDVGAGKFDPDLTDHQTVTYKQILTPREKQIMKLIAQGLHNEQIAYELNISIHTLRTHRKNILKKSSCNSITEVVAKCLVEGII